MTTYPTILQTGFSGLGQSFGLGVSSFGLPVAPNIGNLFPATSFGTGTYGIYGPGVASSSLLGFNRFAANNEDNLVRSAHPTNFFQGLNQNPFPYTFFETPEMNYYNFLGVQSMLANPFEYARVNYINSLYQTLYQTSLLYQTPYQTSLPNLLLSSYQDPLSTHLGPLSYLDPFTQFLGQYSNPFAPVNFPVISPDYSSQMYVAGTRDVNGDVTLYLIIEDNGEDPPKDPKELAKKASEYVKVEEYNSKYTPHNIPGKTCDICLYRGYHGYEPVWAWAEKWWD